MSTLYVQYSPDFGAPTIVSTPTVVLPWTRLSDFLDSGLAAIVNQDLAETVTMTFDTSQDGASLDLEYQQIKYAGPGKSASVPFGAGNIRSWVRVICNTGSGNPASVINQLKLASRRGT